MRALVGRRKRIAPRTESRLLWVIWPLSAVAAALGGVVAGAQPVLLVVPPLVLVPVILWKRPESIVLAVLASATIFEEWTYKVGTHNGAFTANVPLWRTFTHGMILFPIEILLLVGILIWVLRAGLEGGFGIPRSPVKTSLKALWVFLIIAAGVGLSHGAQMKFDLWELRSWIFLTVTFLLAAAVLKTRKAFDAILWMIVIGTGFKGIQGTVIFFSYARHMEPRPEEILGHEEALFLSIFILITVALWLYGFRGHLRRLATLLLPFVVISDMANSRRVSWLILFAAILAMFAVTLTTLPSRRRFLRRALVVFLIGSAIYFPLYWNHSGTLAQPARAFHSAVAPNARDKSSDQYRIQENTNLILNIQASGLLGRGFGIQIDYAVSIADISSIDSMIAYVPHNGVLWVWMRMGLQGEIAFWCFIVAAIIRAARLAFVKDRQLAMLGTVICCSVVGYVLMGYNDMGFAFFRIAAVMGCLIGATEAALRYASTHGLALDEDSPERDLLPQTKPSGVLTVPTLAPSAH